MLRHVLHASSNAAFTSTLGDARNLPIDDDAVDIVLLLGPLYHLTDAGDRRQALAEAVRVTRPGGQVIVAAISRYAALLELAGLGEFDEEAATEVVQLIETGIHRDDSRSFTTAYFHRAEELAVELSVAGLGDVRVLGIEGPSVPALDNASEKSVVSVFESAVRCAQVVETDPALMSASPHLLGLGRVLPAQ